MKFAPLVSMHSAQNLLHFYAYCVEKIVTDGNMELYTQCAIKLNSLTSFHEVKILVFLWKMAAR